MTKAIIIGAGGQARVVYEILHYRKDIDIIGFVDPVQKHPNETIYGLPIFYDLANIPQLAKKGVEEFIVAIGDNMLRAQRFEETIKCGLRPLTAIHPTANIASNVHIDGGTTISIGAIIATGASIGKNVIINSGAIVEHDDIIHDHAHIGPGAALAGKVIVEQFGFIGINAAVKEYTRIGQNCTIGAGSVVLKDTPPHAVAVGIPAQVIKYKV